MIRTMKESLQILLGGKEFDVSLATDNPTGVHVDVRFILERSHLMADVKDQLVKQMADIPAVKCLLQHKEEQLNDIKVDNLELEKKLLELGKYKVFYDLYKKSEGASNEREV